MASNRLSISLQDFEELQEQNFGPLMTTLKNFAEKEELSLSHSFDLDPLDTHASYFLVWTKDLPKGRFIRIGLLDPFGDGNKFFIDANKRKFHKKWFYSLEEGLDSLLSILSEAKQALEPE